MIGGVLPLDLLGGLVPESVRGSVLGYVLVMLCDILRKILLGLL